MTFFMHYCGPRYLDLRDAVSLGEPPLTQVRDQENCKDDETVSEHSSNNEEEECRGEERNLQEVLNRRCKCLRQKHFHRRKDFNVRDLYKLIAFTHDATHYFLMCNKC